jgi:hypothetical protein
MHGSFKPSHHLSGLDGKMKMRENGEIKSRDNFSVCVAFEVQNSPWPAINASLVSGPLQV